MGGLAVNETGSVGNLVVTIRVSGDIDEPVAAELRRVLVASILRRRATAIVVDLQAVAVLDATTVGTLAAACDAARDVRLSLVLQTSVVAVSDQLLRAGVATVAGKPSVASPRRKPSAAVSIVAA